MDAGCAVEATVPIKHRLHLDHEDGILLGSWARVLLPLPPGVETAAGHTQLTAELGGGKAIREGLGQAKPLCGTCSVAMWAAAILKKYLSFLSARFSSPSRASSTLSLLVS